MNSKKFHIISGRQHGDRIESRILEEKIQDAVAGGHRKIEITACGQHGIGGRLWPTPEDKKIIVDGTSGQRLGSMGMMGTKIIVNGSCSDDVGWLNCGAEITVLGDVSNGAHNAGAQGILYIHLPELTSTLSGPELPQFRAFNKPIKRICSKYF